MNLWLVLAVLAVVGYSMMQKKPVTAAHVDQPDQPAPTAVPVQINPALDACRDFYQRALDAEGCGGFSIDISGRACDQIYDNYIRRRESCSVIGPPLPPPGFPAGFGQKFLN